MPAPATPLRIPEHVLFCRTGEEAVLLDQQSGLYYGLDAVGTRIWELVAAGRRPEELPAVLEEEFAAERGRLEADVTAFLDELAGRGLLSPAEGSPDAGPR